MSPCPFRSKNTVILTYEFKAGNRLRFVGAKRREPLLECLPDDRDVVEERPQFIHPERLRPVLECLGRIRMKIDEDHIAPAITPWAVTCIMSRMLSELRDRLPTECEGSIHTGIRVSRLTTGTCAKSTRFLCGSPMFVFIPQAEDHHLIALARKVLRSVQRFVKRNAESAFQKDGKLLWRPTTSTARNSGIPRSDLSALRPSEHLSSPKLR